MDGSISRQQVLRPDASGDGRLLVGVVGIAYFPAVKVIVAQAVVEPVGGDKAGGDPAAVFQRGGGKRTVVVLGGLHAVGRAVGRYPYDHALLGIQRKIGLHQNDLVFNNDVIVGILRRSGADVFKGKAHYAIAHALGKEPDLRAGRCGDRTGIGPASQRLQAERFSVLYGCTAGFDDQIYRTGLEGRQFTQRKEECIAGLQGYGRAGSDQFQTGNSVNARTRDSRAGWQ